MSNPARTEEDITNGLMAMVRYAGNAQAASRFLKSEFDLRISGPTLHSWVRERYATRYGELREKHAGEIEGKLIQDYREIASQAAEVQRIAIDTAKKRLESGEDNDPGRTAANLANVMKVNTDKMLSLSGRPTNITENRNVEEILRSLAAKKIIKLPGVDVDAEVVEIPESTGEGDGAPMKARDE